MKKYKTSGSWKAAIEVVECERESDSCVWIRGGFSKAERRNNKRSSYENYFDSFQEAKDFLIAQGESQVKSARGRLEEANSYLGNAKGLKDPTQ